MTTLPPTSAPGIRFNDRVFVAGQTGSGKSSWINHVAAGYRCQVLVYDTKDELVVPAADPVHDPAEIDWSQRVIHLIDDDGDLEDANRLFRIAWQRKAGRGPYNYGLVVVVHELGDLCGDNPGKTPRWVSNFNRKGRTHKLGLLAGAQRPYNIPKTARTECQHVISFAKGCDPEDTPVLASMHKLSVRDYETALAQARELGEHAYIWGDRRAGTNVIRPPLTEAHLQRSIAYIVGDQRTPEHPETDPEGAPETPELPERSGSRLSGTRSGASPERSGKVGYMSG